MSEKKVLRTLEIAIGLASINLILFPFWGSLVFPNIVAYLILAFDVLWLYKSAAAALAAYLSHRRIETDTQIDWLGRAQKLPDYEKAQHVIIIPNANEPRGILERSLNSLAAQDIDHHKLYVVLAMEERETAAQEKGDSLLQQFRDQLPNLYYTLHRLQPGEMVGKSSNESFAGKWITEKLERSGVNLNFVTITTADCDAVLHPKYLSYLTHAFLSSPNRYRRFWQGALVFYNNIARIPAPARVVAIINTIWQIAQLSRRDRLINISTYSLSLKMLQEVGFWDTDVIPEDYRIFFKCYFKLGGKVEVEPIFLPVSLDAAESTSFLKTVKNQYLQQQRWAWGVSDDPLIIKWWLSAKNIPFWERTIRVLKVVLDHLFWPVNWLIITLGANLPLILNSRFAQTILGQQLPKISSFILTVCMFFLILMIYIDHKQRPVSQRPTRGLKILQFAEWALMPAVGFFLGALPGLDAHLHLLLGKYIGYRVTEKV